MAFSLCAFRTRADSPSNSKLKATAHPLRLFFPLIYGMASKRANHARRLKLELPGARTRCSVNAFNFLHMHSHMHDQQFDFDRQTPMSCRNPFPACHTTSDRHLQTSSGCSRRVPDDLDALELASLRVTTPFGGACESVAPYHLSHTPRFSSAFEAQGQLCLNAPSLDDAARMDQETYRQLDVWSN